MTLMSTIAAPQPGSGWFKGTPEVPVKHLESAFWSLLLLLVNLPLFSGAINSALVFAPEAVARGEWWRLISFPLVHLSFYHLLLDGSAFLLLYASMEDRSPAVKLMVVGLCSAASLAFGIGLGAVGRNGISGLSGIAHGLMAFTALEAMTSSGRRTLGMLSLLFVSLKSLHELITGRILFEFMYWGLCGLPESACHAGGVLGGIAAFALLTLMPARARARQSSGC